jgi:hypothetical protein
MRGLRFYDNGLLGCREPNVTKLFMDSDNELNFKKNLKIKPKDWYYRNCNLSYIYNRHGHRCHEIKEVDFTNYILFVGDSHVEGIGLELKRTFPYLTSQKLGLSYYNLGQGATGIDYMLFNILSWISRYPKPRYIFCYWSDPTRFLSIKMANGVEILDQMMINHAMPEADKHVLVYGEMGGYFRTKHWLASNLLRTVLDNHNIPFYNFYCGHPEQHYNSPLIERILPKFNYDRARDDHYGIETHKAISDLLCEKFNNHGHC